MALYKHLDADRLLVDDHRAQGAGVHYSEQLVNETLRLARE
ncbi:MAG TPA: hypothetical protein VH988_10080 [Thermoanaerobaculia bacterium]|nr:hypothetical protein [Thermoanaerobaculia bacterium]